MNETIEPGDAPEVPRVTSGPRVRVPDASLLPGTAKAPPATVDSLNRLGHAANSATDRFAENAVPKVGQLRESVAEAEAALHARADELGRNRDEWTAGFRRTVRGYPLAAVVAAALLGAMIVRITV